MLRLLLNGTQTANPPMGMDSITEEFFFDTTYHGYLYQISGTLIFHGSDHDTLRTLYDAEFCQDVDIDIQYSSDGNSWISKIKGLIRLSGAKWDLIKQEVECSIIDNSYISKINNNKNTEFQLGPNTFQGSVLSKNGVDVTDKFVVANTNLFSPFRGRFFTGEANYFKTSPPFPASEGDDNINLQPTLRQGMFIYDALALIIAIMTDDEVGFESTYFTYSLATPTDFREEAFSVLMSGYQMRKGTTYPVINFYDLMSDLHKLCDVFFSLEVNSAGRPIIRVESEDYFRQLDSNTYFDSVDTLLENINLQKLYSSVRVGCSRSSGSNFPIGEIPMIQHGQEEYALGGTCNVDNELNLQLQKLIISTNNICLSLPPITGYANGGSVIRKFSTQPASTYGSRLNFLDSAADFQVHNVELGFLIHNTVDNIWSYISGVPDNNRIIIEDQIFTIGAGVTKDYEIFKPSDDTGLDNDVFLIQCNREISDVDIVWALPTLINVPTDIELYYYNETFSNANVLERHMGNSFGQEIITNLTDGNDEFKAQSDQDIPLDDTLLGTYVFDTSQENYRRIRFEDDFTGPTYFDTNGNYDQLTGIYYAPQGGYYEAACSVEIQNQTANDYIQQLGIVKVSAAGDAVENEVFQTTINNGTSFVFNLTRVFYLDEGDRLEVWVKKRFGLSGLFLNQYLPWSTSATNYGLAAADVNTFEVVSVFNGGGVSPIEETSRLLTITSDLSVERSVFDSILVNSFKFYHLQKGDGTYITGFIDKITREIESGETTISLLKKKNSV